MRTPLHFWLIWLAILPAMPSVVAQTDRALLRELAEENKKSVEALVLYPEDARLAILEATKHPEVLIKMQRIRTKTSAAFRTLVEDFPRSTQNVFYDLTRYPDLIRDLVLQRSDPAAMRLLLRVLPEDKRDETYGVATRQMATLTKIDALFRTSQSAFDQLVSAYSSPTQAAFRKLLELPEVVDILNEDLRFTVLVGDVYREDPAWVLHKMDSMNLAVARAQAEELDSWKKTVENDPQARSELASAAREYAAENGYDASDYTYDDLYDNRPAQVEHHYYYHYPYWFGYPWWSPQPCWRPYPYWYYWGFYPHPNTIVIVYLPSYHFVHWYFDRPYHHYHYNHLSAHFVKHYNGHRRSGTTISTAVGEWRDHNRDVISDSWIKEKAGLPERLREYGRFEQERETYNARNPQRKVTPEEFLDKNRNKFPEMDRSRTLARDEVQRERADETRRRSEWAPEKAPAAPEPQPARIPRTEPAPEPNRIPRPADKPRTEPSPQPRHEKPIDDAKDYHRQKWEEEKRSEPAPARTRESAPPKQQPTRTAPVKEKKMEKPASKDAQRRGG